MDRDEYEKRNRPGKNNVSNFQQYDEFKRCDFNHFKQIFFDKNRSIRVLILKKRKNRR